MIGDLHCHTRISDGSMSIDDIIFYAKRAGLDFVAITDHDTMAGLTRASIVGKRLGVGVIAGVEFSCFDRKRGRRVHLLCYYPQKPDRLEGICTRTTEERVRAGREMLTKAMRIYPITAEHVSRYAAGSKSIYKPHILHAIMDLGYSSRIYSEIYRQLFDPRVGVCSVALEYPDVFEVASTIRSAGGILVLAHPGVYRSFEVGEELAEKGLLDGVERYYPRLTQEDTPKVEELVNRYGLICTGGTDFHGYYSSRPNPLATCVTDEDNLSRLFKLRRFYSKV